ncbi:hypothetical protein [Actinoplanes derwentensis]|uniref:Uncharacterized protein n=1 Tax=Actinoplanes derwentensis TaxID=113562 RepID=A0A1H1RLP8_9ACTN|nr:hypothetical protein [Actinoplanes derwentensis]GID84461.1 hypothetical protein Ade03nite_33850 [Actinoplanes derwentensis]SDS36618.1 hypothetical protein SAMN04489716_0626 [Actinoplanes derwentensis]
MQPSATASFPGRALLATGAAIAAAGAVVLSGLLMGLVGPGDVGEPIESGKPATIVFDGSPRMVWATADVDVHCQASSTAGPTSWGNTRMFQDFTTRDRFGVALLTAEPAGEHIWTCTAASPAGLSVGTPPLVHDLRTRTDLMLGVAALTLLALVLGVLAVVRRRAI